ncbi:Leucyl-tRNA synthetase, mitochondrial [Polyrhizophydium stewartii]|uniref:leucine--tRNA ligase n=1 Tax=Polyrhizophydium stewartii TaxID=2732419 RepID=A0ABR4NG62_9FUNG
MFPYPSGSLHMGHARVCSLSDVLARFHRRSGRKVEHPIGWDAFGLPAENAAIERGLAPTAWTQSNIAHMRTQLAALGAAFDWHRELSTSDPAYFRWTQHLFLRLWRAAASRGLAHDAAGMPPGVWTGLVARHPLDSSVRLPVVVMADMLREPGACRPVAAVAGDSSDGVMDAAKALARGIACTDSELAAWIVENAGSDGLAASVRINTDAWLDGGVACRASSHRLRDWLVSRQRSWGTPIPIVHCDSCGPVPVPDDQLPVTHTWTASSTHKAAPGDSDAAACACPKCNGAARRETDTMDTFVDSSWYWLRYLDLHNTSAMASPSCSAQLPVDVYIGGIEHAIMHLLYARFIAKFLAADGVVALERGEPFARLLAQGVVLGTAYRCPDTGKYLAPTDVDTSGEPRVVATGKRAIVSVEKMSKSKHNGVDPMPVFERHGVDATRLYLLYRAAPQDELMWDGAAIVGMERFLARVRTLVDGVCAAGSGGSIASSSPAESGTSSSATLAKAMADAREQVTAAMRHFGFPVAVASLIKLSHAAAEFSPHHAQTRRAVDLLLRLLHPFAPVVTLELAGKLAGAPVTTEQLAWPSAADAAFEAAVQICVLQINGKKAAVVEDVPAVIAHDHAAIQAHDHAAIQAHVLASPVPPAHSARRGGSWSPRRASSSTWL